MDRGHQRQQRGLVALPGADGPTGIVGGGNAIAFDAEDVLYHTTGARFNGDSGTVNIMNTSTGRSTVFHTLTYLGFPFECCDPRINAMDFHPVTEVLYVSANFGSDGEGNTYLATLDPLTGVVSNLGLSTGSLEALAWGNDCGDGDPCTIDRCEPGPSGLRCTHAGAPDTDGDGLCDAVENCPGVANPGQEDQDADGTGNVCDTCPLVADPDQRNSDGDALGDLCETCPYDPTNVDSDGDGLCDDGDGSGIASDAPCAVTRLPSMPCDDNCPHASNAAQTDTDVDGLGDVCDACTDRDGDGFGDPGFPNDACPTDNCGTDGSRLANGNFEAGNFTGWTRTTIPSCCGTFTINVVGTPVGPIKALVPTARNARGGRNHAYSSAGDNSSPVTQALSQSFLVPPGATRVRVLYQMFVTNGSGSPLAINPAGLTHTQGENHHARVDLMRAGFPAFDTGAGVLRNFYIGLDPGPLPNPWRDFEFDVTSDVTPGSSYVLRFAVSTTHPAINLGVDNVRVLADPGQPDADGDAVGDQCDCAPLDASAGRPGPITDLMATSAGSWTWSPLAAADQYQVTRGLLSALDVGRYGSCFASVAAPPLPPDQEVPPPGDGFLYLIQGKDASCGGLGSLGYSHLGDWPGAPASAERINLDPLACP